MTTPCVQSVFTVLVDQREQAPYGFTGLKADADKDHRPLIVPTKFVHLPTGDYSIEGLEARVAIERKSLADLYSTLGQGRERFEAEHQRLAAMDFAAVVIEATWPEILQSPPERSKLPPKTVFRTAASWMVRYGVPWLALGGRRLTEVATYRLLEMYWRSHQHRRHLEKDSIFRILAESAGNSRAIRTDHPSPEPQGA